MKKYPADPSALRVDDLARNKKCARWCERRGLDAIELTGQRAAFTLLHGDQPEWTAFKSGKTWHEAKMRVVLPLFDSDGEHRSWLARSISDGASLKSSAACGCRRSGLVLANARALALLRGEHAQAADVIVCEGEVDYLTWCQRRPDVAVFGVYAGAWTREHGARIPAGSTVVIRTHHDVNGDKYADQIGRSLEHCQLRRSFDPGDDRDDNDLLLAGELGDGLIEGVHPFEPRPEETAGQLDLGEASSDVEAERALKWSQERLARRCEDVRTAPPKGRNDALFKAAAACSMLRKSCGGPLDEGDVRDDLVAAGVAVGQGRDEAKATVNSAFDLGSGDRFAVRDRPEGEWKTQRPKRPKRSRRQPVQAHAVVEPAPEAEPAAEVAASDAEKQRAGRPWIDAGGRMIEVVTAAEEALADSDHAVYQRMGELVRPVRYGVCTGRTAHMVGAPVILPLKVARVRELVDDAATFFSTKISKEGEVYEAPVRAPKWVAETLQARGEWTATPYLEQIAEVPVLCSDGRVIESPGYDAERGVLYDPPPGSRFPSVPATPTAEDARTSLVRIARLFADFPFAKDHHASACLAALLTAVARPSIRAPVPLFLIQATTPGSGKTLIAKVIAEIASGRSLATASQSPSDEEEEKRFVAMALSGFSGIYCVDNITKPFGGPVLSQALTSERIHGRELGKSRFMDLLCRWTWLATGQNVQFRDDLARRVVPITLAPECERPEERDGFGLPNLLGYVRKHRAQLVVDALTILRHHVQAGRLEQPLRRLGGFEAWGALVRGAVVRLGLPDPCDGMAETQQVADTKTVAIGRMLEALEVLYGQDEWTAGELARRVNDAEWARRSRDSIDPAKRAEVDALELLGEALVDIGAERGGKVAARSLGYQLRAAKGRIVDGRRLGGGEKGRRGIAWVVERA